MRKPGYTRRPIRWISCMLALVIGLSQPCFVMAEESVELPVEDAETTGFIRYITAFTELAEEDAYFPCMYKPMLEEIISVFPESLFVQLEGEDTFEEIGVTWVCEDDFDNTKLSVYIFYPQWDETLYALADSAGDNVEIPYIVVEVPAGDGMISDLESARSGLQEILETKSILALVYLCDKYEVRENPSTDSAVVDTVVCGQSVQITDAGLDEDGYIWYQVLFYQNGTAYTGYVERDFLATSDEDFKAWEESNLNQSAMPMMMAYSLEYPDIEQFPASYQNALYALKEKHPNWIFVRMDTGLDWNTVIAKEMGDKSLVPTSSSGSWQTGVYGQGWSYASEGILKYYIDPRNFLTDPAIFQFEQLTYNSSYHTTNAVQEIVKNSFMASTIPGDSQTYAQAFTNIGQSLGISPFHLASRVLQEQGAKGTSMLISGTYPGYEGYYNYFNVGASGKTNELVIQSGLKKAREQGWNTRYKSLYGGAYVIGVNYILKGQDTLYLEKFNVSNGQHANFTHQYMQNIQAPASEASNIRKAYYNAGALENSFVFKIPVYNNMPASACSKPEVTDAITLNKTEISGLEVNKTTTLIPYVNGSKVDHTDHMTFTSSNTAVAMVDAQGKVTAVSPGTATITCTRSGANTASCTVTVIKADPAVSTPVISPITYQENLTLSAITLPDGWKWQNSAAKIAVGTFSYPAVYTPADTVKYNTVTKDISFTVTKAVPHCQVPTGLEGKAGDTLGSILLPEGFIWESNAETVLSKAGEYTFYVSYDPDENNYYSVDHVPVIVRVTGTAAEENTSAGSTSGGSSSSGSTTGDSSSSGSTTGDSSSSGSTTGDSSSSGSTPGGGSSAGSTSGGSTSEGDKIGGSISSGSTSSGSTTGGDGTDENTSGGSISSGSTTEGDSAGGSISAESTSSGSTTEGDGTGGSISSGSTSSGSTTGGESTGGNTSVESTSGGGNSTGSTSSGSSTGSTSGGGLLSSGNGTSSAPVVTGSGIAASTTNPISNMESSNNPIGNVESSNNPINNTASANDPVGSSESTNDPDRRNSGTNSLTGSVVGIDNSSSNAAENSNTNQTTQADPAGTLITPQVTIVEQAPEEERTFFKPAVTIPMEDTTILTPEKLQAAKEQNFDILLDMGDYVTWSIDIDSVNMDTLKDVDMGVTLGTEKVPRDLIAAILNGNKYMEVTLAHEGAFGFSPVLNIALNPENSGRYANLFYYDPEAGILEFICDTIIDERGIASFRMEHASSYIIIVSDYSMAGMLTENETDKPMVRWIITGVFIFMLMVVMGCAIFFYCKKRRELDDEEPEDDEENGEEYNDEEDLEADEEFEDGASFEGDEISQQEDADEDDWIEDKDWHEPEVLQKKNLDRFADDHSEDDWIDDDEWDIGNDWMDDDEWERKNTKS
ncbi:MAG: SH3 domain-containing protein [Roseburia sp.]|nr:SH3 domain-containing protein [Roseburia sp.]MCM1241382.1 SH3 domain-containing protein [Roseburia sp.]